ncbi:PH domain-containing protein [Candidatus Micrarchaeota archaeon]|jgi:uncharacterized membrane protein YdbT with pleckstrin-like domain|nr:PH domain-containing protein [Candidatus Micrarchaeota archaeon]
MGDKYKVDKKVKILWMIPYTGGILILWLISIFLLFFVQDIFPAFLSDIPFILSVILLLVAFIIFLGGPPYIWMSLRYDNLTYELEENHLIISEGVISKKQVTLPYNTIENMNVKHSLTEQLLGIHTLELATSGTSGIEGTIQGLSDPKYIMSIIKSRIHNFENKEKGNEKNSNQEREVLQNEVLVNILNELKDIKTILNNAPPITNKTDFQTKKIVDDESYNERIQKLEDLIKKRMKDKK